MKHAKFLELVETRTKQADSMEGIEQSDIMFAFPNWNLRKMLREDIAAFRDLYLMLSLWRVIAIVMMLFALLLLTGCAPMSEQYWSDKYESMSAEELESARNSDATVTDIYLGAQTHSKLVCIDGECVVVRIY